MSTGDERAVTRRAPARADARRGVPSWAHHPRSVDDAAPRPEPLPAGLEADGWTVLAASLPPRPGQPGRAPRGHVLVGPGGVVVVDVRADAGRVDVHDGVLRCDGHPLTGPVERVAAAAAAVTVQLAPRHRTAVRPVVCLADRTQAPARVAGGATVVGHDGLAAHLRTLPPRLRPVDAAGLADVLRERLAGGTFPEPLTTAALVTDPRVGRRRVVRPLTAPAVAGAAAVRPGRAATALRVGVVLSVAWLAWVFTTAPLGLG